MSNQGDDKPAIEENCGCITDTLNAAFFKALCDPNRIALLAWLAKCCGARKVSDIACCCPVDLSVVSRHLAILREAGILDARKCGKEVYYSVRFDELVARLRAMADSIEACCGPGKQEKETDNGRNEDKR